MSKARKIYARGLTKSDVGRVIEYTDTGFAQHKVRVDDVTYEQGKTLVSFSTVVRLPNNLEISVIDS